MDPIAWIKWVLDLAKPDRLKEIVNLGGPIWVGYTILAGIVFSETGLLIGFFLPGDSLLFSAGLLASQSVFNLFILNVVLCIAAIAGDAVNYALGYKLGAAVFDRPNSRLINKKHLLAAHEFYERYGGKAIVLARFVPLVRTFTPFVAGVVKMTYSSFVVYNIIGGVSWVVAMTVAGYTLGQIDWVQKNFEKVVILIVLISLIPVAIGALNAKKREAAREEVPS